MKCEIRLARFTVTDVINGAFESERARPCVSKNSEYLDIVAVNTLYERVLNLKQNDPTTKEDVLNLLPTAISVTLDDGTTQIVSGRWTTNWFSANYVGTYRFTFIPDDNTSKLQDMGDYFVVRVIVGEKDKETTPSGCNSVINTNFLAIFAVIGLILVNNKRKLK